jgi:hypothetical protein
MPTFDLDLPLCQRLENMGDMMNRLGLGPQLGESKDAIVLASAVRTCENCPSGGLCRDWLTRAAATLYKPPAFCPNADRFAQLLAAELAALRRKAATMH